MLYGKASSDCSMYSRFESRISEVAHSWMQIQRCSECTITDAVDESWSGVQHTQLSQVVSHMVLCDTTLRLGRMRDGTPLQRQPGHSLFLSPHLKSK